MRELEIYIHIPFCVKKCAYCDFLSAPAGKEKRECYVKALLKEIRGGLPVSIFSLPETIEQANREEYIVTSVFFGGGTPSILPAPQIVRIMEELRTRFRFSDECESTIECNPGTMSEKEALREESALAAYRACGISRISFGLQSADNNELAALGRIHTWETFLYSYQAARKAGFTNINVDLMSALPGQTVESWENTLRQILMLAPEHISAYSLIIEEGTPFYQMYHEDDIRRAAGEQPLYLPSEDEERRMYALTEQLLGEAGYKHYEISNYARPGYECRHNIGYWRGREYMGFGLGASSLIRCSQGEGGPDVQRAAVSVRCQNPTDHAAYERRVLHSCDYKESTGKESDTGFEILSAEDEMSEFMFLGLRMLSGVSETEFARRFRQPIDQVYADVINRMASLDLLKRQDGRIFLTPRGLDLSNLVMAEFLL
ncbi:MAG: radical SAM family heme chaperone HemW [Lachnospiraceae bacterium]|nr:radical SAM family heme chaperone HemW [Lachnospiraceae bacterium]